MKFHQNQPSNTEEGELAHEEAGNLHASDYLQWRRWASKKEREGRAANRRIWGIARGSRAKPTQAECTSGVKEGRTSAHQTKESARELWQCSGFHKSLEGARAECALPPLLHTSNSSI